ncbi:hypothetical protein HWV62_27508 [Athelia sp. TMB]|nr:hypothetical protein HWV62_27508 [Athelia sp. TMB]
MQPPPTPLEPEPEPEELIRFREAWRKELEQKKAQSSKKEQVNGDSKDSEAARSPGLDSEPGIQAGSSGQAVTGRPTAASLQRSHGMTAMAPSLIAAVGIYRRAVQCEQQSQLDEALQLYRQAFRMDANVDRAFHKIEQQNMAVTAEVEGSKSHRRATSSMDAAIDALTHATAAASIKPTGPSGVLATGTLASVVAEFPADLKFEPEDEKEGTPINMIPDELLVHILKFLNTSAIERFASISRKARVICLDSAIWRELVEMTYMPPQVPVDLPLDEIVENYMFDYRRMFIEHPRVRLDGVYIALPYMRAVEKGHLRMLGLIKSTLAIEGHHEPAEHAPSNFASRYVFQMTLTLGARPMGRWNRLDFDQYDSVDLRSGEVIGLGLKHERPFWFSKVRSYA